MLRSFSPDICVNANVLGQRREMRSAFLARLQRSCSVDQLHSTWFAGFPAPMMFVSRLERGQPCHGPSLICNAPCAPQSTLRQLSRHSGGSAAECAFGSGKGTQLKLTSYSCAGFPGFRCYDVDLVTGRGTALSRPQLDLQWAMYPAKSPDARSP